MDRLGTRYTSPLSQGPKELFGNPADTFINVRVFGITNPAKLFYLRATFFNVVYLFRFQIASVKK